MQENFRKTLPHEIRVKNFYTGNHRILYIIYVHNYLSFLIRLFALMKAMNKHLPQSPFTGEFFSDEYSLHCLLPASYLSTILTQMKLMRKREGKRRKTVVTLSSSSISVSFFSSIFFSRFSVSDTAFLVEACTHINSNVTYKHCCISMKFWYGTGCGYGSCIFSSVTFKTSTKNDFFAYYFLRVFSPHFSKIKSQKKVTNRKNQMFFLLFLFDDRICISG
jgi:hypothetical protein